jgi:CheY-like chemotaxis protein
MFFRQSNIDELYHLLTFDPPKEPNDDKVLRIENSRASSEKVFQIPIAEDIEMNKILIKTLILEQLPKAKIFECSNGEIALKTLKNHPIDLVIMDVKMPVMDGLTATRKIRAYERLMGTTTPIIGLTADALKEEKEKCLEAGMEEFLNKPIQPQLLIELIEKYPLKITKNGVSEKKISQNPLKKQSFLTKRPYYN